MNDTTNAPLMTTAAVADRLGVARKQIRAWVHRGLLAPCERNRQGYYLWSEEDVAAIARVREMADARAEYLARHARIAAGTARPA